ncbi:MAG: sugar kinase [Gammaproteobacteria bacterium]|nr:sugar kinase [Gammaproteobacteria bacterium]
MASILGFGEIMLRLSTPRGEVLSSASSLDTAFGGAEANTIIALAGFGHNAAFLTCQPDNDWGRRSTAMLAASGIRSETLYMSDARIGTYFLETGVGRRGGRIIYDRKHSAFACQDWSGLDWSALLRGVDRLHLSGITLALSESAADACEAAARAACEVGCGVSFDANYRSALWADPRDFGAACRRIAALADVVFCGCREIRWMIDQPRPDEISPDPAHGFHLLKPVAPNMRWLAGTLHDQDESGMQRLGGFATNGEDSAKVEPRGLGQFIDRVGGGDAFAAGILHGLAEGWPVQRTSEFAHAAAALKHTIFGDQLRASAAEVQRYAAHGAAVSR